MQPTSDAHNQASIWYSNMHKVKRESKSQGIKRKQQDMFRGSSTQLYIPAFTQKDFHYNIHTGLSKQGTSTEDLGNTTWGT